MKHVRLAIGRESTRTLKVSALNSHALVGGARFAQRIERTHTLEANKSDHRRAVGDNLTVALWPRRFSMLLPVRALNNKWNFVRVGVFARQRVGATRTASHNALWRAVLSFFLQK